MSRRPDLTAVDRAPRVLLTCDWFIKYTAALANGLAERGCDVMLLTRERSGEIPVEQAGRQGVRDYVRQVLGSRGRHLMLPGRVRDVHSISALRSVRAQVRAFSPEVVHLQESVLDDPRLLVASGVRARRYAVTFHDPTPHPGDPVPGLRRRLSEQALLKGAGLVFVHSEVDRVELLREFALRAPVAVVPHGTGTPDPTPLPDEPVILFFGRLVAYKGLNVLLDALPRIWAAVPDATVVIAGAGEYPVHPLLADDRVDLRYGHVREEEVPELFKRAKCVVLPYLQASQSGVGSQAKIYGRPLVVTDTGGLPELVADGSGKVVAPGEAGPLADALISVLAEPGVAQAIGERSLAGGLATDWPQVAQRTIESYQAHLPLATD